ncbi:MAG: sortase [Candidatus Daviesbacteria bacterium]|nr:sortase [Candidatus Daviesbacteria bacterium]
MNKWCKISFFLGLIFLFLTVFFILQRYIPLTLAKDLYNQQNNNVSSNPLPLEIIIPSINLDLPVIPAKLVKGKWELSSFGVSYLIDSDSSDILRSNIFYGHNWPNLLGNITKLQLGEKIIVKFSDGFIKEYKISAFETVNPEEVSILFNSSDSNEITLYTCTGFLDGKRFIVRAMVLY